MEYILLGVDGIILGLCLRDYFSFKNTAIALKQAKEYQIDENLRKLVNAQPDKKLDYAIVRGTVRPIGTGIPSVMSPSVVGVIQLIKLSEHRVARGIAGFWTEQRKLIHISSNEIPFTISNGKTKIEVIDGLSAEMLDLDVVYDSYEPSSLSFFDHIFGFFSGVRQRGIQTTEEMLRDGSFITAVGEIESNGDSLRLQVSDIGPVLLSTATKNSLIKKFEDAKAASLIKSIFFASLCAIFLGVIAKKIYLRRKQKREEAVMAAALEEARQARRIQSRPQDLTSEQQCIVCFTNPKEIICLPCGHVCMCEDCSKKVRDSCPVCRKRISQLSAAFIV